MRPTERARFRGFTRRSAPAPLALLLLLLLLPASTASTAPDEQPSPDLPKAAADGSGDDTGEQSAPALREEVEVSATRLDKNEGAIAGTVTVLQREELDTQTLLSTEPSSILAQTVPGFSPGRQKLSGRGESFRGRSPLYLVDGVPQSNPLRDGARDGFTIDPAMLERVEVLHGANALQGLGATGGVVNYVTREPRLDGEWGHDLFLGLTAPTDYEGDGLGWRGSYVTSKRIDELELVLGASFQRLGVYFDAEGRPIGVDGTQGDTQESDARNLFLKLGYALAAHHRVELTVNDYLLESRGGLVAVPGDADAGIPTTSEEGAIRGTAPENDVSTISFKYVGTRLLGGELEAQIYRQEFSAIYGGGTYGVFQDPDIAPVGELFDQSRNVSEKNGLRLTWTDRDLLWNGSNVALGLDYLEDETFQELAQTGRRWVPTSTFANLAPFVQLEQAVGERVTLAAGVRHETAELEVDDFTTLAAYGSQDVEGGSPEFDETLFNASARAELGQGLSGYLAFSEGFTMPDVGRVLRGIDSPGLAVEDFLTLEPVISDNREIGFDYARGPVVARIAYFESSSDLGQRLNPDGDGIFSVEREKTEIDGIEVAFAYQPTPGWEIGANWSSLDGRFDSDDDGRVDSDLPGINIAPDRFGLFVAGTLSRRVSGRVQATQYQNRTFDGPGVGGTRPFDGYTLVDLITRVGLGRGAIEIGVENLFDEQYITYFSQTYEFANDMRTFAGRGRTLTLGYRLRL
jgi:iron complex outermembrane receptor protein